MPSGPAPFAVFTFSSTHDALDAEALLLEGGVTAVPIPAPPDLSATCGIALRVPIAEADAAAVRLERAGIDAGRSTITDW